MTWVHKPSNKLLVTVQDRAGKRATVGFWINAADVDPTDAGPTALAGAIEDLSDGALTKKEVLQYAVQDAPATPAANVFRGTDKVRLRFADGNGVKGTMELGAIKPAYLQDDGVSLLLPGTTGPAAAVKALYDALKAVAVTAEGAPVELFFPAKRLRNPGIKKQ